MKVSVTGIAVSELAVDLLVVFLQQDEAENQLAQLTQEFGDSISKAGEDIQGEEKESVLVYAEKGRAKRLFLVGTGAATDSTLETFRKAASRAASEAKIRKCETVGIALPSSLSDMENVSQAVVEGFLLSSYTFERYKKDQDDAFKGVQRLILCTQNLEKNARVGAERGRVVAESAMTARDLVNTPPADMTAAILGKSAEKLARKYGFEAAVWGKSLIEEEKMGGLLAVNKGSEDPPTFTILEWQPENAVNSKPLILIGKGVVYDTGGLSLKPTKGSMDYMKSDMAGAAAVVGTFEAVARLELPVHLVGLVPATDNRPGKNAYVPGDVVQMHSGSFVEVLNTDAEGRMLLADALSYATTYKPDLVIDAATLTGSAVIALGSDVAALMSNTQQHPASYDQLMVEAGHWTGERVHPMPMFKEYAELLKSKIADLKNIGGREAGSITAAKFLEHFVDYPWMHLDIAGPSFLHEAKPYKPAGGSGFGVRLLVEFIRRYIKAATRKG